MNWNSKWLYGSAILLLSAGFTMALIGSFPKEKKGQEISKSAPLSFSAKDSRLPASVDAKASKSERSQATFNSLLRSVENGPSLQKIARATEMSIVKGREVQLNEDAFRGLKPGETVELQFDLFNGKKIQFESKLAVSPLTGGIYIEGRLPEDPVGWVSLTYVDGILVGHITTRSATYKVIKSTSGPARHYLVELDRSKMNLNIDEGGVVPKPPEGLRPIHSGKSSPAANQKSLFTSPQTNPVIAAAVASNRVARVYLVYDQTAIRAAGGENAVRAELANEVSQTNSAFSRSLVEVQLEIAAMVQSSYSAPPVNTLSVYLNTFASFFGGGPFADLKDSMLQATADIAVLYVHPSAPDAVGIAFLGTEGPSFNSGFAVVSREKAPPLTFAHEVGHLFGANHDEANAQDDPKLYARGFIHHPQKFHTIMAYPPSYEYVMIPYFSSPSLSYNGITIGNSRADNSLRINQLAALVANYAEKKLDGDTPDEDVPFINLVSGTLFRLYCPRPTMSNPTFQWHFNGQPIPGATRSEYLFEKIQPNQRGAYHCIVTNGTETIHRGPTAVGVDNILAPVFHKDLGAIDTLEWQSPLSLSVDAYSLPERNFQWFRLNGSTWVPIPGQNDLTLNIAKMDWKDQGQYAVQVENGLGQKKMSAAATVRLKPVPRGGMIVDGDPSGAQKSFTLIRTGGFEEVENKGAARPAQ